MSARFPDKDSHHDEPHLKVLIESLPVVIYTCSPYGDFAATYVSQNIKRLWGYDPDMFMRKPNMWVDAIHPDDKQRVLSGMETLFENDSYEHDYRFRYADGSYHWMHDSLVLKRDSQGHPKEIVGYVENIDARKVLDQELEQSNRFTELLSKYVSITAGLSLDEVIHATIRCLHSSMDVVYTALVIKDVHGRSYVQYSADNYHNNWPEWEECLPDAFSFLNDFCRRAAPVYRPCIKQSSFTYVDDEERLAKGYVSDLFVPLWAGGHFIGLLTVASDQPDYFSEQMQEFVALMAPSLAQSVLNAQLYTLLQSERKNLETYVEEREQALAALNRFRRALDTPKDAVFLIDPDEMRFIDFNQSAANSLGYSSEELSTMGPQDIKPEYTVDMLRRIYERIVEEGLNNFQLNTVHKHKTGEFIPVEILMSAFHEDPASDKRPIIIAMVRDISERQKAELALAASEQRFRTLVDQCPFSTQILDATGKTIRVNNAWEKLWGIRIEDLDEYNILQDQQLIEKGVMPYIHKAYEGVTSEIPPIIYNLRETPGFFEGQYCNNWIRAYAYPVLNENGEVQEVILMHEDISHKIKVEEDLKQSEEKWRLITSHTPDHILLLDNDLEIQFANFSPKNSSPEDMIGTSVLEYIPDAYVPVASRCFDRVLATREDSGFEYDVATDGVVTYYDCHVGAVYRNGQVEGLVVSQRDISRRKCAEIRSRQSAAVIDNTAEGVVMTDAYQNIVSVNRAFSEITGYSENEVLGKNPNILRSDRHDKAFFEALWQSITSTGRWQGEIWDRRKNGEVFPAWTTITAIYDSKDEVINYVSVFSDISTIKQSQEKLDFLAYHDPLTNLPNRLLFNDRLEHAIRRAHRDYAQVAVLFIDLDRFKYINDSLGHPIGDQLIQAVAKRLKGAVRDDDTVARIGGDEFVIIMEDVTSSDDVAVLAEKVMTHFHCPFVIGGHEMHMTLSIGISLYPQDGTDREAVIKSADIALYQVKEEGRNNYHFYTYELANHTLERLSVENAMRHALDRNQLQVFYQPQYDLDQQQVTGCEALMRWHHPEMGAITPDRFIPIAEDSGLIIELGAWILRSACEQMKRWRDSGATIQRISVNVSALQLLRSDFSQLVARVLADTGLPPHCLELELTESIVMRKTDCVIDLLAKLKILGVSLVIDDFGTGYSSLAYLKQLPINKLKIDRSFIMNIPQDANDVVITEAIIAMANSLKIAVIAEGVESEAQCEFLYTRGCKEVQGFYHGKPVTSDEFYAEHIKRSK